jgi:4-hydroxy-4-methyl-2-oxoglutarate aldolase
MARQFGAFDTADISDALYHSGTMLGLSALTSLQSRICGPALTLSAPLGGVYMLRLAMDMCVPGDVLVIAARGQTGFAMFGGHVSVAMRQRGLAALVVDGCVRDLDEIRDCGLPIFARGTATIAAPAETPAEVNVPVACGGVVVNPGDLIVADSNGVVRVPQDADDGFRDRLDRLVGRYENWEPQVRAGEVPGLSDAQEALTRLGCEFVQESER